MKQIQLIIGIILLFPNVAGAQQVIRVNEAAPTKFLLTEQPRRELNTQQGVRVTTEQKPESMRSDKTARSNGALRADKGVINVANETAVAAAKYEPAAGPVAKLPFTAPESKASASPAPAAATLEVAQAKPANNKLPDAHLEPESEEIAGRETKDPLLNLYGNTGNAPLPSFREAMGRPTVGRYNYMKMQWPVPINAKQYVSSGYGMRSDPFHGRPTFHGGVDIAAAPGTPVLATADAIVAEVAQDGNYGKYITLQHYDGTLSRYGHLNLQNVKSGQRVFSGQIIGAVGATGRATGPHLDYRVSKNGTRFDPMLVLTVPANVGHSYASYREPRGMIRAGNASRVASNTQSAQRSSGPLVIKVR